MGVLYLIQGGFSITLNNETIKINDNSSFRDLNNNDIYNINISDPHISRFFHENKISYNLNDKIVLFFPCQY